MSYRILNLTVKNLGVLLENKNICVEIKREKQNTDSTALF